MLTNKQLEQHSLFLLAAYQLIFKLIRMQLIEDKLQLKAHQSCGVVAVGAN